MKRFLIVCVALGALSGCGTSHKAQLQTIQQNPQAHKDEAKAQAIYRKCVPDPLVLRDRAARQKALACAVPSQNRSAAVRCEVNGMLGHVPTTARIEQVTLNCIGRYA